MLEKASAAGLGGSALPANVRQLFWDCSADELDWEEQIDFIVGLTVKETVRGWVRDRVG